MAKRKKKRSKKAKEAVRKKRLQKSSIKYKCLECGTEEDIPRSAIEMIDIFDEGLGEPEFECKKCNGIMETVEKAKIKPEQMIHIKGSESFPDGEDWMF